LSAIKEKIAKTNTMSFAEKLLTINQLQQTITQHGKLSDDLLKRINYKFRLEWNYTSNSMEGNSLTKQETRSVMVGNITVDGKPIKDVLEIKGHDEVITRILQMGAGELNISEKRIKEVHKAIVHEEDPAKQNQIGVWKTEPNYLHNYKGERFDFVAPAEVPARMHELINKLNKEKNGIVDAIEAVELAFWFHLEYITIHPFYDGNGRTARIFTNLILISYGLTPLYIKEEERNAYYQYLADIQGYGGSPELFYEFMADRLIRSLQMVLDAIEGKEIEDPEDLDKKIQLLELELSAIDPANEVKLKYNDDVFFSNYETWIKKSLTYIIPVIQKFNKFFTGIKHQINIQQASVFINYENEPVATIIDKLTAEIQKQKDRVMHQPVEIRIQTFYGTLIKGGLQSFGCNYSIRITFEEIKYEVTVDRFNEKGRKEEILFQKLLHQGLLDNEMLLVANELGKTIYNHIDYNTKERGIR